MSKSEPNEDKGPSDKRQGQEQEDMELTLAVAASPEGDEETVDAGRGRVGNKRKHVDQQFQFDEVPQAKRNPPGWMGWIGQGMLRAFTPFTGCLFPTPDPSELEEMVAEPKAPAPIGVNVTFKVMGRQVQLEQLEHRENELISLMVEPSMKLNTFVLKANEVMRALLTSRDKYLQSNPPGLHSAVFYQGNEVYRTSNWFAKSLRDGCNGIAHNSNVTIVQWMDIPEDYPNKNLAVPDREVNDYLLKKTFDSSPSPRKDPK